MERPTDGRAIQLLDASCESLRSSIKIEYNSTGISVCHNDTILCSTVLYLSLNCTSINSIKFKYCDNMFYTFVLAFLLYTSSLGKRLILYSVDPFI